MSTGLIIAIIVVALILLVLFAFVLPRARRTAKVKARERELEQRRERVAGEHRAEAEERRGMAERAEQKAQMAQAEAERERAEAQLREQRAQMHERGMADDELIDESERDRFAGTSAMSNQPTDTRDDDRVTDTRDDDRVASRDASLGDQDRPMHEPDTEYEQGRVDEAREREERFGRSPETERTEDPTRRA
jgi:FtsZ-interacting cell division protein ZipA